MEYLLKMVSEKNGEVIWARTTSGHHRVDNELKWWRDGKWEVQAIPLYTKIDIVCVPSIPNVPGSLFITYRSV